MHNLPHIIAASVLALTTFMGTANGGDPEVCGQPDAGDCFDPNNSSPGCSDEICCIAVCNLDNFCCTQTWDETCVGYAITLCGSTPECGDENSGDCYTPNGTPACDDSECCSTVCSADSYCCDTLWDAVCADTAVTACFKGPAPENDECIQVTNLGNGDSITPFDTLGATTSAQDLPAQCETLNSSLITNDVWYSWTATTNEVVLISTCNDANFDTRLAAYSGNCDTLEFVGCNDDGLGCETYTSKLMLPVSAGTTYYIQLGGLTITSAGQGNLSICEGNSCVAECIAECDETSISEAEFCGQLTNDGCNDEAGGYPVELIEVGDTVCGSFWAFGNNRDTDWYQFTTTEILKLNLEVHANLGVSVLFASDECPNPAFQIGQTFDSCPAMLEACLPAGTWRIFIAPNGFDGAPCGSDALNLYQFALTSMPFDTPGNSCEQPIALETLVGEYEFTNTCTTTSGAPLQIECSSQGSQQIYNDIFFSWTAPFDGEYVFSTCNQADFDTRLAVYESCSGDAIACNDDATDCSGRTSEISIAGITAGQTLLLRLGSWSNNETGSGILSVSCLGDECEQETCPKDYNQDGEVNGLDFGLFLTKWGPCQGCPEDINLDGVVNGIDVGLFLVDWGPCD